jgi:hypothetical protein
VTLVELKAILAKRRIRKDAVIFENASLANEQYCMILQHGGWNVFYAEKGHSNDIQHFADESSACAFLLSVLERDRTVWME